METITSATIFKAFDGKIFTSENECKEYEAKRKDYLNKFKFFEVKHSPDLTETGFLLEGSLIAVYSDECLQYEIAFNYCIKRFGYLGPSVMGCRLQKYFSIKEIDCNDFNSGKMEFRFGRKKDVEQVLLSPKEHDEFKNIKRFNYKMEWGIL
ncbi:MAG: hypothetical protein ACFN4S_00185 [Prevotella conceptionensis]